MDAAALADDVSVRGTTRTERDVCGWTLHIDNQLMIHDAVATELAIVLLKHQLEEVVRVVPRPAVAELQKVFLYFSLEYPGKQPRAEFHPSPDWLKNHGRDPVMAEGIEFTNIRNFEAETRRMPNFALHELAHAYHYRVLPRGFDHPEIDAAFDNAKSSGKYTQVQRRDAEGRVKLDRAYAMSNPMEYFAESTEAYFSRNDFFPFNRDELQQHDPAICALLADLWQVSSTESSGLQSNVD